MPPPLSPDEARRLDALERDTAEQKRWRKEHDAEHVRLREDLTEKVADMTNAAVRHVERVVADGLKPVTEMRGELMVIKAQNVAQMTVLERQDVVLEQTNVELAANRLEREKRAAADEAKAKLEKDAKDTRDADLAVRAERTKRLGVYALIIGAAISGLVAIIVAAITSHH